MATIQQIKQAPIAINETALQELCDEYLSSSDDSYTSISRPYVKRILEIANGNPRMAIMAARMAIKNRKDWKSSMIFLIFTTILSNFCF